MARPPGQRGSQKVSGRKPGSLDKAARQVVTDQMAANILETFDRLGGLDWLLTWAKANESTFVTAVLSRLFPAFPKDPDIQINQQFNGVLDAGTDLDIARRVAFMLAKAAHELDDASGTELQPYVYTPAQPYDVPPEYAGMSPQEAVRADPAKDAWAESLTQTEDERICAETQTASLETYRGGAGEGMVDRPRRKRDLI